MRVILGLLGNSQNRGSSPWDVMAEVLQLIGGLDRWVVYLAVGRRQPLARYAIGEVFRFARKLSRSCGLLEG